jgi:hypothetical protein
MMSPRGGKGAVLRSTDKSALIAADAARDALPMGD